MDYYLDIKVLPDPEFSKAVLMNALFAKLHRILVELKQHRIGISFPDFGITLGDHLRIHGSRSDLEQLADKDWLKGLGDYTTSSFVTEVPVKALYRIVTRVQAKSNPERLRRRSVSKGWLSEDEAIEKIPATREQHLSQPYLQIRSSSTGQSFLLFIKHCPITDRPTQGSFSSYGLSNSATVPWF